MIVTISGLPSGLYRWISNHHDGGGPQGSGNGNIQGLADYSTGVVNIINGVNITRNDTLGDVPDPLSFLFASDGSDLVVTFTADNGQGAVGDSNSIFFLMNSLVISDENIPEPSTIFLGVFGAFGLLRRRR